MACRSGNNSSKNEETFMQQTLSDRALALYTLLRREYVRSGYIDSGCVSLDLVASRLGFSQEEFLYALSEMMEACLVQQRDCKSARWELTALVRCQLLIEHRLSELWEQQAPHFYPNGAGGEIEHVVDEVTRLCRELAGKLIQVRTASPLTPSGRETLSSVFPLSERRAHQLVGPREDLALAEHSLDVLQAYATQKFLGTLKSAPVARFADEAAARFISVTHFDSMPQWRWKTARWIVTCLFTPQEHWIDRPCIVRAVPVSQDPDGSKTRNAAEKWRSYVASVIRGGMQEHLKAREQGRPHCEADVRLSPGGKAVLQGS